MHLAEGVVTAPLLAAGAVLAAAGTWAGLRQLREERLPEAAMLSSAFFVVSLIHVPVGLGSIHLLLNGLLGLLLGWVAVPAILVALALQAVIFGHGGLTTLGVNTVIMALPAVTVHLIFGRAIARTSRRGLTATVGFLCGSMATWLATALFALTLYLSHSDQGKALLVFSTGYGLLALVEGAVTGSAVVFLKQVRPQMLKIGGTEVAESA